MLRHILRLDRLLLALRRDFEFEEWKSLRRTEVHSEVAWGMRHAVGDTVAGCCKMALAVRHIVLDLPFESLTMSPIEARMP